MIIIIAVITRARACCTIIQAGNERQFDRSLINIHRKLLIDETFDHTVYVFTFSSGNHLFGKSQVVMFGNVSGAILGDLVS